MAAPSSPVYASSSLFSFALRLTNGNGSGRIFTAALPIPNATSNRHEPRTITTNASQCTVHLRGGTMSTSSNGHRNGLRSANWFGRNDLAGFAARGWTKNQGYPDHLFEGRP